MNRSLLPSKLLVLTASVYVVAAVFILILGGSPSVRGEVQLAVFPLLIALLALLSYRGVRVPRILLGMAAIGVFGGALLRHTDVSLKSGAFGISPFHGDALENKSVIFRDNVRANIGKHASSLVGLISSRVDGETQAQEVLRDHPHLGGVVWGRDDTVSVTIRSAPRLALSTLPPTSVARRYLKERNVRDLYVISQIPGFTVSKVLDGSTFEFMGRMLRSLNEFPLILRGAPEPSDFEHSVIRAATMRASWVTIQHLAVPRWMLGTLYLKRAISGPEISRGDLDCAEAAFKSARIALVTGGYPILFTAILNNEALVRLFKAEDNDATEQAQREARVGLLRAYRMRERYRKLSQDPNYWSAIEDNVAALGFVSSKEKNERK